MNPSLSPFIAVVLLLLPRCGALPFYLPDNVYQAPTNGQQRAPCPGLNSLANHGFIHRNGTDISMDDIAIASERVFGFHRDDIREIINEIGDSINYTKLNLSDLYNAGRDLSLIRNGVGAAFNESLFQGLVKNAVGETISLEDVVEAQVNMIYEERKNTGISFRRRYQDKYDLVLKSLALDTLTIMSSDPSLETVSVSTIRSLLEHNRLSEDFVPRQERGL